MLDNVTYIIYKVFSFHITFFISRYLWQLSSRLAEPHGIYFSPNIISNGDLCFMTSTSLMHAPFFATFVGALHMALSWHYHGITQFN